MGYNNPTVTDFKNWFIRDFPYGTDPNNSILDQDIANAYTYTNINFNPGLWSTQESYTLAYLLLSAHFLVSNIRQSSQGLNGQYNFLQASKGVGSISEGFSIPQRVLDNPFFSMLTKTNYGSQYLQILLPQLCGQIYTVRGTTLP